MLSSSSGHKLTSHDIKSRTKNPPTPDLCCFLYTLYGLIWKSIISAWWILVGCTGLHVHLLLLYYGLLGSAHSLHEYPHFTLHFFKYIKQFFCFAFYIKKIMKCACNKFLKNIYILYAFFVCICIVRFYRFFCIMWLTAS